MPITLPQSDPGRAAVLTPAVAKPLANQRSHADQRFGWVGNRHDIHTAGIGALSRCGAGCEVIVELYPPAYAKPLAGFQVHRRCRAFLRETQPYADCVLFYGPVLGPGSRRWAE